MQSLGHWGKTLPISTKKMMEYIRWRQTIATPFANRSYQSRPKATHVRRYNPVSLTRPHKDKLSKPRKVNVGHHPKFMQRNWPTTVKAKEVTAAKEAPAPAQPAEAPASQSSGAQSPKYNAVCTPLGKLCPSEYPITANWQDKLEEESQEQVKDKNNFSVCSDWDADLEEQDWKKCEEQKNNDSKTPQPSSKLHQLTLLLFSPPNPPSIGLATKSVHHQKVL